jgi:hypothetical protein
MNSHFVRHQRKVFCRWPDCSPSAHGTASAQKNSTVHSQNSSYSEQYTLTTVHSQNGTHSGQFLLRTVHIKNSSHSEQYTLRTVPTQNSTRKTVPREQFLLRTVHTHRTVPTQNCTHSEQYRQTPNTTYLENYTLSTTAGQPRLLALFLGLMSTRRTVAE